MIHQLKSIEKSQNRRASHTLIGISSTIEEEWLWTAFIKGEKVLWVFASHRSKHLNGRELQWKGSVTIPSEAEVYIEGVASKVGLLFRSVEVS
ncbi:hypothetical protein ACFFGV_08320 [Pontibacillus salicampi]|uniref:Uncharacterized protein n=1 Tax=Pontibacillus salicampi TaxID=1449801 RepID=A0ABV6LMS8_9BACI